MGAINTMVLIFSSLTMAWAVRASALGQRKLTSLMLVITLACAAAFMVVKYFEYSHKFHTGLLPGAYFLPTEPPPEHAGLFPGGGHADEHAPVHHEPGEPWHDPDPDRPINTQIFFGIYFLMTGLHGIHVLAGMAAIGWILVRNLRGDFSAEYNSPVELVGLYWHLVDLIWIYLFPLLYLIS
jgi:cytochrome c oxidase subunit 3